MERPRSTKRATKQCKALILFPHRDLFLCVMHFVCDAPRLPLCIQGPDGRPGPGASRGGVAGAAWGPHVGASGTGPGRAQGHDKGHAVPALRRGRPASGPGAGSLLPQPGLPARRVLRLRAHREPQVGGGKTGVSERLGKGTDVAVYATQHDLKSYSHICI